MYSDEIKNMTWSFSRCHAFEQCPYEWYLKYIEQQEPEQNFFAAFGSFCHELLERILTNELSIDEALVEYIETYDDELCYYDVGHTMLSNYYQKGLDYFSSLDFDWLKYYDIVGVECELPVTIGKNKFITFIDLLLKNKETEEYVIIDHKSSRYPLGKKNNILKNCQSEYDSYLKQLNIYALAVFQKYGEFPTKLEWNYFKELKWLSLDFNKDELDKTVEWVNEIIKQIKKEKEFSPNKEFFYCNNLCGFRNECIYKEDEDDEVD